MIIEETEKDSKMIDNEQEKIDAEIQETVDNWINGGFCYLYNDMMGFHDVVMGDELTSSFEMSNLFHQLTTARTEAETLLIADNIKVLVMNSLDSAADDKFEQDKYRVMS